MGELVVDLITSLDGYASAEGWPGWWGLEGPEYLGWLEAQPERGYTMLMGANTYRVMSGFAGTGEDLGPDEAASVDELGRTPKVVCSSTLEAPLAWDHTEVVSGDALSAVRDLKEGGRDLRMVGSPSLCRSLLQAGLVDRFRVGVFPVITGATGSERIYDGYPDVALDLRESLLLDGRIQILEYAPTVLAA
ncbi:MAG: dihydrofolate reductase family protein [Janibacter sp.]